jgi:hypothetical protein
MNRTVKNAKVVDATKFNMVKDRSDRALFLTALDFKFRNSFYLNKHEMVEKFGNIIDQINDPEYLYATAWYLGKILGLRLSPVLLTTRNVYKTAKNVSKEDVDFVVNNVFTRPDFISNAMVYYKMITKSSSISNIPDGFKSALKTALENFSPITLKKRKMKRREVKLADMIKVLRPRPSTPEKSLLYKAIIENTKGASLVVEKNDDGKVTKADSFVAVLSDKTVTKSDLADFVEDNLEKIAINELITNLSNIELNAKNIGIIGRRLSSIFNDAGALRFLNPFDLLMIGPRKLPKSTERYYFEREAWGVAIKDTGFKTLVDNLLIENFINTINIKAKNPLIMFDISGSMQGDPAKMGIKVLSFLLPILGRFTNSVQYFDFGNRIYDISSTMNPLLKKTPYEVAEFLCKKYENLPEGTALLSCLQSAISATKSKEIDGIIIISDEMTWADSKEALKGFRKIIPDHLHKTTFLYNVNQAQTGGNTAIEPSANISRVSGLDAKSLFLMEAMFDFDSFKNKIISAYRAAKKGK